MKKMFSLAIGLLLVNLIHYNFYRQIWGLIVVDHGRCFSVYQDQLEICKIIESIDWWTFAGFVFATICFYFLASKAGEWKLPLGLVLVTWSIQWTYMNYYQWPEVLGFWKSLYLIFWPIYVEYNVAALSFATFVVANDLKRGSWIRVLGGVLLVAYTAQMVFELPFELWNRSFDIELTLHTILFVVAIVLWTISMVRKNLEKIQIWLSKSVTKTNKLISKIMTLTEPK